MPFAPRKRPSGAASGARKRVEDDSVGGEKMEKTDERDARGLDERATTKGASFASGKNRVAGARASLLSFEDDGGVAEAAAEAPKAKTKKKRSIAAPAPRAREVERETVRTYDVESLRALAAAQRAKEAEAVREAEAKEAWTPRAPPRDEDDGNSGIPDAKTIAEVKSKREAARRAMAGREGADYIDLGDGRGRDGTRAEKPSIDSVVEGEDDEEFERAQLRRVFRDEPEMRKSAQSVARDTMKRKEANVSIEKAGLEAFESLKRALEASASTSETARKEATRADENAAKSQSALAFYEKELKSAGERYVYAQKLRDYFKDACAMMQDKKLIVEELMEHYSKFHVARARALTQAMNHEFEESTIEAEAAAEAAHAVFQRGGSQSDAKIAASTAVQDAVLKGLVEEKLDDMGRDVNMLMREKAEARSKRRQSSSEAVRVVEDEREVELFHKDWSEAQDAALAMFKDASDDLSTLTAVKKHAEDWKRTHLASYKSTYMSASVPHLFAPFVRLELIAWSPLFPPADAKAPASLDSMSWYAQLFDYGMVDGSFDEGDEDANLLPKIVEHLVLPIVSDAVEQWWEPRDPAQSRALASTLRDVLVYVEPNSCEEAREVVIAVRRRLKQCAEACTIPTYAPAVTACAPDAARHAESRFRLALDVIKSALAFDGVVERDALDRIVFDGVIAAHVAPFVRLQLFHPAACAASLATIVDALGASTGRAPPSVDSLREITRALVAATKASDQTDDGTATTIARVAVALGA